MSVECRERKGKKRGGGDVSNGRSLGVVSVAPSACRMEFPGSETVLRSGPDYGTWDFYGNFSCTLHRVRAPVLLCGVDDANGECGVGNV